LFKLLNEAVRFCRTSVASPCVPAVAFELFVPGTCISLFRQHKSLLDAESRQKAKKRNNSKGNGYFNVNLDAIEVCVFIDPSDDHTARVVSAALWCSWGGLKSLWGAFGGLLE